MEGRRKRQRKDRREACMIKDEVEERGEGRTGWTEKGRRERQKKEGGRS